MTGVPELSSDDLCSRSVGRWIWVLHRYNRAHIERCLKPHGIGFGQFRYLLTIHDNYGLNQEELSHVLELDKTTTTRSLARLEEGGFIRREPDPGDNRAHLLHLTQRGRAVVPHVRRILKNSTKRLLEGFDDDETAVLLSLLGRLYLNARPREGPEVEGNEGE